MFFFHRDDEKIIYKTKEVKKKNPKVVNNCTGTNVVVLSNKNVFCT